MKPKKRDVEGEILALGWDTESKGGAGKPQFRAMRGMESTQWHADWLAVLAEVKERRSHEMPPSN